MRKKVETLVLSLSPEQKEKAVRIQQLLRNINLAYSAIAPVFTEDNIPHFVEEIKELLVIFIDFSVISVLFSEDWSSSGVILDTIQEFTYLIGGVGEGD